MNFFYIKSAEIVKTTKTYIDGELKSETAWCSKPELDRAAIMAGLMIAATIFHQVVMI